MRQSLDHRTPAGLRGHQRGSAGRRLVPVAAALASVAMVAAACGGVAAAKKSGGATTTTAAPTGGSTTTTAAGSSTTASAGSSTTAAGSGSGGSLVPAKVAAVAALVPRSIASKGTLTFAEDATYPPDEFVSSSGKVVGMDADLAKALAGVMGLKPVVKNVTFNAIIPGLQAARYDVGLSSFTDTKKREKVVTFVTYFKAGEAFYVKASGGPSISGLSSLCGKKVAVESGTTEEADAKTQSAACTKNGKPAVTVQVYQNQNEANLAVSSGRADLGFLDSQVAAYVVKQSNGAFKLSGQAFKVAPYGIAVPKSSGLAKPMLAAVKALMTDG
ncbi:MAG: ABC transporter substrate-binding protein, partial [Acidimicrobiales bacterium]